MFGYVTIAPKNLSDEEQARYRAFYCGLCRALHQQYGIVGRLTLSYDMTFLHLLLAALYEPCESREVKRCPVHPLKKQPAITAGGVEYAAAMNVLLAYYKAKDDWQDNQSVAGKAMEKGLKQAFEKVKAAYPDKCEAVYDCLKQMSAIERGGHSQLDAMCNLTGRMLGEIYAWKKDIWESPLRALGESIGRFIYLMDAYEDLKGDIRAKRYNPLKELSRQPDYEELVKDALTLFIAEGTDAFEVLPILQDANILRNVLYGGIWGKYTLIQVKREKKESKYGR